MNPFDFVNSINSSKKEDLLNSSEVSETDYVPFVVNKSFSYFPETLLYANELNKYPFLDNKLQYHYLLNSIRPGKRYTKWVKRDNVEDIDAVKEYFKYNTEKALQALSILTIDNMNYIKEKLQRGRNNDQTGISRRSDAEK